MRAERRGGGLGQRVGETWPDTERTLTMTTRLAHFARQAREEPRTRFDALMGLVFDPEGLHASFGQVSLPYTAPSTTSFGPALRPMT